MRIKKMKSRPAYFFENFAWRGIRLEARCQNLINAEPQDISIGWHNTFQGWDLIEYIHFESGPSNGRHYYFKTWEEVLKHMNKYSHNLKSFNEEVSQFIAEKIAEKV